MTTQLDFKAIRRNLIQQRARLREMIAREDKALHTHTIRNPDRFDRAQDYVTRERRLASLLEARRQLAEVAAALQRLADGRYGQCIECGAAIEPERLQVLPLASRCVRCQAQYERTSHTRYPSLHR
jgi:DnaK suppressor protein